MLTILKSGHVASCPAPRGKCSPYCEAALYRLTALLALVTGLVQAVAGYHGSMALLSDALHAIADAVADAFGAEVALRAGRNPHREDEIRKKGNRVIAILLALAALWVLWETWGRFQDSHSFSATLLILIGAASFGIDHLRTWVLSRAQLLSPRSTRAALIAHARSDRLHGALLCVVGSVLFAVETLPSIPQAVPAYADLGLSGLLAVYMLFLSYGIWRNEHHHH